MNIENEAAGSLSITNMNQIKMQNKKIRFNHKIPYFVVQ